MNPIKQSHIELIGYSASALSIVCWLFLAWQDPYFEGMNQVDPLQSFLLLVLPACLFGVGLLQSRVIMMLAAFVWSVPFSVFMLFSSSGYALFGVMCIGYLVCIVLCRVHKIRYW
ncbi:hypothetical protein [Paenibacillus montanisoli]|uniref:hypothetical protein n=1 Tax=Paenibacillus montanisoli TaxID=2081970 RepID=UPI001057C523|nr:hypothetical protein [Paenibacillus montanisoli]